MCTLAFSASTMAQHCLVQDVEIVVSAQQDWCMRQKLEPGILLPTPFATAMSRLTLGS